MNPYARFRLVSNAVSAAILLSGLAAFGKPLVEAVTATAGGGTTQLGLAGAAGVGVLVVFWVTMTEAIFPALFRFDGMRKLILGKYYMEGTWLQSERGEATTRMSVIDIQPKGNSFSFTGYSLNKNLEIESNSRIEFSQFDWPFMTYKHRNSLSDGSDGMSEGVGELQFEMNRSSARRYNGYLQYVRGQQRLNIEGVKLTKGREIKRLRTLEGRREICAKYWELFFNQPMADKPAEIAAPPRASAAPTPIAETVDGPVFVERRKADTAPVANEDGVIPRRRASDWVKEPETKAAKDAKVSDIAAPPAFNIDEIVEQARKDAESAKASVKKAG
ncbi:MAG: hypothetical protein AAFY10_00600 [Pseudomonadota bacterium]